MDNAAYRVYWSTEGADSRGEWLTLAKDFTQDAMAEALRFTESLRAIQRANGKIRFITMCAEHPDSVGNPGVDVTGPEYNWKKRRV